MDFAHLRNWLVLVKLFDLPGTRPHATALVVCSVVVLATDTIHRLSVRAKLAVVDSDERR